MNLRLIAATALLSSSVGSCTSTTARTQPDQRAHAARSCSSYVVITKQKFGSHRYKYTIRIQKLVAQGLTCKASRQLIRRADAAFHNQMPNPGQYISVAPWRCRMFRPFAGGPQGQFKWLNDCKQAGGKRLSWTEEQLHAHRIS
jgi:hypothetical protein